MPVPSTAEILDALRVVQDPDLRRDIVALDFVKQVGVAADGRVSFAIELTTPACPVKDLLREQARAAVAALSGVTSVDIEMTSSVRSSGVAGGQRQPIRGVKNVVAVGAGKGGVGKTTMAVNLAISLARRGSRVGLLDADIYGPNVPIMLGVQAQLETDGKRIVPIEKHGLFTVSMGFLTNDGDAVIWRGPMLHGVLRQFLQDVAWPSLDYLIVDMPPGTGDVALSLSQHVAVTGAVVVTTPQTVSVADSQRAIAMYRKLNIPVLGVVENMSYYTCPSCSHESDLFGRGGGQRLADQLEVPFLGAVPISEPVRSGGDIGMPIVLSAPDSPAARAITSVAEQIAAQVSIQAFRTIPLTPVS
ncbi:MAG: Mrp/NBP35 family ATP-binding protein [Acidobacteria bacterium]|jgi:ATP-binding protein involved in chromosome partitioning|nr:Mrp/NBP35 family ATP-binding protein [Acidobacteriota bacterium]